MKTWQEEFDKMWGIDGNGDNWHEPDCSGNDIKDFIQLLLDSSYKDGHTYRVKQERKKTEDKVHKHYQEEIKKIIAEYKDSHTYLDVDLLQNMYKLIDTN
jgi:actin-related protein